MDIAYLIRRAARQFPNAPAVGDRRHTDSLATVIDRAERLANSLDTLGVPPGAAVGVLSENRTEYPEVDIGIALGARVRVALNSRLHGDDFRYALNDCGARALIHSGSFAEEAAALANELDLVAINFDEPQFDEESYRALIVKAPSAAVVRAVDEEGPAWISYTAGTTGKPKGVVLSHRAICNVAMNLLTELGPFRPDERLVLTQPLSHGAGYSVLPQLVVGGGVYIMGAFDPEETLWAAGQPGINALKAVPAMFPLLMDAQLSSSKPFGYETVIYGAAPMPGPVLEQALELFGPTLVEIYGQSEAPLTLTCLHKEDHMQPGPHRSSAGRPWRTVAVEVRDPKGRALPTGEAGEVTVRGTHHMTGYHRLPEMTADVLRDGWLWTKDMGVIDERGYLHLLGRQDEMINSGGFNISPREVERVLEDHPAVAECVVVGLPDTRWGSAVNAVVQLRSDEEVTTEELLSFVRPRLTFRTPKRLLFADDIPKTAYGKVNRSGVMRLLAGSEKEAEGVS